MHPNECRGITRAEAPASRFSSQQRVVCEQIQALHCLDVARGVDQSQLLQVGGRRLQLITTL